MSSLVQAMAGTKLMTSHYLNQWRQELFDLMVSLDLSELTYYWAWRSEELVRSQCPMTTCCEHAKGLTFESSQHEPDMMTSSNGNIFRITGPLCGEFTGPGEFPTQRPVTRSFHFSLICVWINGWVNNREAGDLRRHRGHYDVSVIEKSDYTVVRDTPLGNWRIFICSNLHFSFLQISQNKDEQLVLRI